MTYNKMKMIIRDPHIINIQLYTISIFFSCECVWLIWRTTFITNWGLVSSLLCVIQCILTIGWDSLTVTLNFSFLRSLFKHDCDCDCVFVCVFFFVWSCTHTFWSHLELSLQDMVLTIDHVSSNNTNYSSSSTEVLCANSSFSTESTDLISTSDTVAVLTDHNLNSSLIHKSDTWYQLSLSLIPYLIYTNKVNVKDLFPITNTL
jgi:hypothetical protein